MGGISGVDRLDYAGEGLSEEHAPAAPLAAIHAWVDAAVARGREQGDVPEPTALSVATVDADGMPDVRTVLMRLLDATGPAFFTGMTSAKGQQLAANPVMAASLTWPSMFRAIRFRGQVQQLDRDVVTDYFRSRPYGSRIGAHASAQSSPVAGRAELEQAYRDCEVRWPDHGAPDDVPVPQSWGGYRLVPDRVEMWAGRRSRLHDRIVWERSGPGGLDDPHVWRRGRIQP